MNQNQKKSKSTFHFSLHPKFFQKLKWIDFKVAKVKTQLCGDLKKEIYIFELKKKKKLKLSSFEILDFTKLNFKRKQIQKYVVTHHKKTFKTNLNIYMVI